MKTKVQKKFLVLSMIMLSIASNHVKADLIDRGGGLIYDDHLDLTWLQDAFYAGIPMNWADSLAWADNLEYYDTIRDITWDDWRLFSIAPLDGTHNPGWGYNVTNSEPGHLYYTELNNPPDGAVRENVGPFINVQENHYWAMEESAANGPVYAWDFGFNAGYQVDYHSKAYELYAWAVRDGDVAIVPTPSAFLLGSVGLSFAGWRLRKNKV